MPFADLRAFLADLDRRGELDRVGRAVDRKLEVARVAKRAIETQGPALVFRNVRGFRTPVVTGTSGARERVWRSFGTTRETSPRRFEAALLNPAPPSVVAAGPCQEVCRFGADVNLLDIPALWHHEKDAGYYLTATNVLVADPETGVRNNSIHRGLVLDGNRLAIWENIFHLNQVIRSTRSRSNGLSPSGRAPKIGSYSRTSRARRSIRPPGTACS